MFSLGSVGVGFSFRVAFCFVGDDAPKNVAAVERRRRLFSPFVFVLVCSAAVSYICCLVAMNILCAWGRRGKRRNADGVLGTS